MCFDIGGRFTLSGKGGSRKGVFTKWEPCEPPWLRARGGYLEARS